MNPKHKESQSKELDLRGFGVNVDAGDPLEVLLEEAFRIILPDLLPRHRRSKNVDRNGMDLKKAGGYTCRNG